MADTQVTISVPSNLQDTLNAVLAFVVAVKGGAGAIQLLTTELPTLLRLLTEVPQIPGEAQAELGPTVDATLLFARKLAFTLLNK